MKKINLEYPCKIDFIEEAKNNPYFVSFPDIPEAISEGENLEHAKKMAKEVLSLCLDVYIDNKKNLPKASKIKGNNIYMISAELGKSTTYSKSHKKSYNKNKSVIISKKRQKELELKKQGYKDFREMIHENTLNKLNILIERLNIGRRDFLTLLIEKEYEKIT